MKKAAIVLLGLSTMACILCSCGKTGVTHDKAGDHDIEITETTTPFSSSGRIQGGYYATPDGGGAYVYKSKRYDIKLEGEALTVNGKSYVIPHKNDSIRVHNGRVWINGQRAKPAANKAGNYGQLRMAVC